MWQVVVSDWGLEQKGSCHAAEKGIPVRCGGSRGGAEQELGEWPESPLSPQGPRVVSCLSGSHLQAVLPQGLSGSSLPLQDPIPKVPLSSRS